jgi:hypothetical protein
MGIQKIQKKKKLTGKIPGTGRKKTRKGQGTNNANAANDVPATTFPHWRDLLGEVRLMIRAFACNYELFQDRIVEARINITWRPSSSPGISGQLLLHLDSPPGPYQAPIRTIWQGGYIMYANRFPNLLLLGEPTGRMVAGNVGIEFNASRDIIFMDARSLYLLNAARHWGYDLGGFNRIINLATPMANNNIEGLVHDLRERGDPLEVVVDPIRLITDVQNSINDSASFVQYARGILGNNYGGAATDAEVADFFGPPY